MLPAITGNIDVPGGWVFGMHGLGRFPSLIENLSPEMNAKRLGADRFKMLCGEGADLPAAHIPTLLQAMREGVPYPVKAFMVFGNNTLATYGNSRQVHESLLKLDLLVAADLFMTPTTELADIVLPAASWPELNQVAGLPTVAANVVLAQQKAVQIGECKSDEEIFVALARRMKLPVGTESVEEVLDAQIRKGCGLGYEELKGLGFHQPELRYRKYQEGGFKTPTGKIELYSTNLEKWGYAPLPYYEEPPKARCLRPRSRRIFRWCSPPARAFRSSSIPNTARSPSSGKPSRSDCRDPSRYGAPLGIKNKDWVWIETPRGKIKQKARVTDEIDARVVHIEHGWWFPEEPGPEHGIWKSNANVLTSNAPPYDPAMGPTSCARCFAASPGSRMQRPELQSNSAVHLTR